eukprot:gnl/Chilomastix_cuspidata/6663.p1 GENE.gnl/Chilomastix_cuspidata/6663~~gnl/Chilomastix_cuspidata/6663.p1  ORF type:complete len:1245 (+),score=209.18 gnl/Chilomastix_cuspidata/6663:64-3798(+)
MPVFGPKEVKVKPKLAPKVEAEPTPNFFNCSASLRVDNPNEVYLIFLCKSFRTWQILMHVRTVSQFMLKGKVEHPRIILKRTHPFGKSKGTWKATFQLQEPDSLTKAEHAPIPETLSLSDARDLLKRRLRKKKPMIFSVTYFKPIQEKISIKKLVLQTEVTFPHADKTSPVVGHSVTYDPEELFPQEDSLRPFESRFFVDLTSPCGKPILDLYGTEYIAAYPLLHHPDGLKVPSLKNSKPPDLSGGASSSSESLPTAILTADFFPDVSQVVHSGPCPRLKHSYTEIKNHLDKWRSLDGNTLNESVGSLTANFKELPWRQYWKGMWLQLRSPFGASYTSSIALVAAIAFDTWYSHQPGRFNFKEENFISIDICVQFIPIMVRFSFFIHYDKLERGMSIPKEIRFCLDFSFLPHFSEHLFVHTSHNSMLNAFVLLKEPTLAYKLFLFAQLHMARADREETPTDKLFANFEFELLEYAVGREKKKSESTTCAGLLFTFSPVFVKFQVRARTAPGATISKTPIIFKVDHTGRLEISGVTNMVPSKKTPNINTFFKFLKRVKSSKTLEEFQLYSSHQFAQSFPEEFDSLLEESVLQQRNGPGLTLLKYPYELSVIYPTLDSSSQASRTKLLSFPDCKSTMDFWKKLSKFRIFPLKRDADGNPIPPPDCDTPLLHSALLSSIYLDQNNKLCNMIRLIDVLCSRSGNLRLMGGMVIRVPPKLNDNITKLKAFYDKIPELEPSLRFFRPRLGDEHEACVSASWTLFLTRCQCSGKNRLALFTDTMLQGRIEIADMIILNNTEGASFNVHLVHAKNKGGGESRVTTQQIIHSAAQIKEKQLRDSYMQRVRSTMMRVPVFAGAPSLERLVPIMNRSNKRFVLAKYCKKPQVPTNAEMLSVLQMDESLQADSFITQMYHTGDVELHGTFFKTKSTKKSPPNPLASLKEKVGQKNKLQCPTVSFCFVSPMGERTPPPPSIVSLADGRPPPRGPCMRGWPFTQNIERFYEDLFNKLFADAFKLVVEFPEFPESRKFTLCFFCPDLLYLFARSDTTTETKELFFNKAKLVVAEGFDYRALRDGMRPALYVWRHDVCMPDMIFDALIGRARGSCQEGSAVEELYGFLADAHDLQRIIVPDGLTKEKMKKFAASFVWVDDFDWMFLLTLYNRTQENTHRLSSLKLHEITEKKLKELGISNYLKIDPFFLSFETLGSKASMKKFKRKSKKTLPQRLLARYAEGKTFFEAQSIIDAMRKKKT